MAKRGTGFRPVPGAQSCYQDSGSRTNRECSPINVNALPFGADGTRAVPDNEEYNRLLGERYKGGKVHDDRVPQGEYGEDRWVPAAVLKGLYQRWRAGENVDRPGVYFFEGSPADYEGDEPTHQELTDYQFLVAEEDGLNNLPDSGKGGAANPTPTAAKFEKSKYFVTGEGRTRRYWLNTLWKPSTGPMYGAGWPENVRPEQEPSAPPVKPPVEPTKPADPAKPPSAPTTPAAPSDMSAKVDAILARLIALEGKVSRGFKAIRKGEKP